MKRTAAVDVAVRRRACLHWLPREGPDFAPKLPFRCDVVRLTGRCGRFEVLADWLNRDRTRRVRGKRLNIRSCLLIEPGDREVCARHVERLRASVGYQVVVRHTDYKRFLSRKNGAEKSRRPLSIPSANCRGGGLAPRRSHHDRNGARGKAADQQIGAARQDDRHARAKNYARSVCVSEKRENSSPACCRPPGREPPARWRGRQLAM